jgi:hypothetical protein
MPPEAPAPMTNSTWYRELGVKRTAIVAVTLLAIGTLIAITLLLLWRASPEKALLDAIDHVRTTPGTYVVKSPDMDTIVTVSGQQFAVAGKIRSVPIEMIVNGNTVYARSPDPQAAYKTFMSSPTPKTTPFIDNILVSLKDRWFTFNLQSLPIQSADIFTVRCLLDAKDIFVNSDVSRQQFGSAYLAHPFLSVKAGDSSVNQSVYTVTIDGTKRTEFYQSFAKSNLYQSLTNCSEKTDPFQNMNFQGVSMTATVSQPDHVLKTLQIHSEKSTTTVTADYLSVPKITMPSNAVSLEDIANKIIAPYIPS